MALLLWANLTGIALFLGIAFTAQLEARRARGSGPDLPNSSSCLRSGPTPHAPSASSSQKVAMVSEVEFEEPLPDPGHGPALSDGEGAGSRVWGGAQDGQDPPRRTREPGGSW
jgi:hypothetical protein